MSEKFKYRTTVLCLSSLVLLLLNLVLACNTPATEIFPPPTNPRPATPAYDLEPLRVIMKAAIEKKEFGSIGLTLVQDGKKIFQEAYGWADVENQRPFKADGINLLASNTKAITTAATLTLVSEGKIDLDAPVSKYLPGFDNLKLKGTGEKVPPPTVRQTLSCTSGWFSEDQDPDYNRPIRDPSITLKESVELISKLDLHYKPGTAFFYYGAGFQVASRIAEVVSGKPYEMFIKERLFDPLGMKDSTFRLTPEQGERFTNIYISARGNLRQTTKYDAESSGLFQPKSNLILTSGGLYSTMEDELKVGQMLLNRGTYEGKKILTPEVVAEMLQNQTANAVLGKSADIPPNKNYGFGLYIDRMDFSDKTLSASHTGLYGPVLWVDLDRNLTGCLFLASVNFVPAMTIQKTIRGKMLENIPVVK